MIDVTTAPGARALERLRTELIAWLTTVNADGQPQSSPVWFLWDDGEIVVCSLASTPRVRNIRADPRVAVNLNSNLEGGDIVTVEGEARIVGTELDVATEPAYRTKYEAKILEYGWTWESFRRDYPVVMRIRPTRVRLG
jgi:PPOX class probable F420-dependent enzyme